MAKSNYPHKQRSGGSNRGALIALLVLLIIAAAVFLLRSCTDGKTPDPAPGGIVYDPGAVEGGWNEADTDKIVDALNEKVEQGMINISMNTTPIFQNGSSAGNLMIVNESVNNYPQVVEIHRNDTGEVIYKSGAIPVGSKLETAKLSADLDAGDIDDRVLRMESAARSLVRLLHAHDAVDPFVAHEIPFIEGRCVSHKSQYDFS